MEEGQERLWDDADEECRDEEGRLRPVRCDDLDEPAQQNGDDDTHGDGAVGLWAEIVSGIAADNEVDMK